MEKREQSSNYLKKIVAAGLATSALAAGYSEVVQADESSRDTYTSSVEQSNNNEIVLDNLRADWEQAMEGWEGQVNIAVYDLETGQTAQWATPGADHFNSASIIKYAILVETLRQKQTTGESLSDYELEQARMMIQQSGNPSATYLWDQAGGADAMQEFFDSIDMQATTASPSWGVTSTTALDQLQVLKQLTPEGTTLNQQSIDQMNQILDGVAPDQHWGVSGGVPENVDVNLKNGWLNDSATMNEYSDSTSWTVNSIGMVGDEYIVAILSEGNPVGTESGHQNGVERLETLSEITWQSLSE